MKDTDLTDHPEGGRYKEVFRSDMRVQEKNRKRRALTHIYFSLNQGEVSRFHRVESDEVWNLYEGPGLTLFLWDPETHTLDKKELSRKDREYCCVVSAGLWQAAVPAGQKVLVGCSVAPGFEFSDFTLITPSDPEAASILAKHPELKTLVC